MNAHNPLLGRVLKIMQPKRIHKEKVSKRMISERGGPRPKREGEILNEGCSALLSARADGDSFSTLRRNLQLEHSKLLCSDLSAISCLGGDATNLSYGSGFRVRATPGTKS